MGDERGYAEASSGYGLEEIGGCGLKGCSGREDGQRSGREVGREDCGLDSGEEGGKFGGGHGHGTLGGGGQHRGCLLGHLEPN